MSKKVFLVTEKDLVKLVLSVHRYVQDLQRGILGSLNYEPADSEEILAIIPDIKFIKAILHIASTCAIYLNEFERKSELQQNTRTHQVMEGSLSRWEILAMYVKICKI